MSTKYNGTVVFPTDSQYIIRCIEEVFGQSAAGNPMITFTYEVVSPEEVEVAGEMFNIAGTKVKTWQVTQTMNNGVKDGEKSAKNLEALTKLYTAFGLPTDSINPENPTLGFKGKSVYAQLTNDQQEQRKSPTSEQLKAGQKQGDIMIHPITKALLMRNSPKIREVYGLAPVGGATPY